MYELYPYFTNDGSVGLFSRQDDDIYHSTYGALTESWQKFILPAHLEEYLTQHDNVKILDICYGIGYNTKVALNVFIKNYLGTKKTSKNKEKFINKKLFSELCLKKTSPLPPRVAAIHTDNTHGEDEAENFQNKPAYNSSSNSAIYTDNINARRAENNDATNSTPQIFKNLSSYNPISFLTNSILIDTVDLDGTLIKLSPFIADVSRFNFLFKKNYEISIENKLKYQQIKNIRNFKKFIKKEFRLKREVSIILLEKLFESNPEFFNDVILQTILHHKKYAPFLSRFMINFAKFYQNQGCNYNKNKNKSTFLHNIYYRNISKSYKNAGEILKNNEIDMNFYKDDARNFIKSVNNTYNFIFLDAFTPAKCPALWTVQFIRELYSKLEDDGMILTYSNSAAIRNAFLQCGFAVGKIYDNELRKFVGTVAAKNKTLIKHELSERDLDLINSKAGICFKDENLNLDNNTIIENRKEEIKKSNLSSSSKILKGYKNDQVKPV